MGQNGRRFIARKGALKQGFPGQGQAQPLPYTVVFVPSYRVGAGLAPALVAPLPRIFPAASELLEARLFSGCAGEVTGQRLDIVGLRRVDLEDDIVTRWHALVRRRAIGHRGV